MLSLMSILYSLVHAACLRGIIEVINASLLRIIDEVYIQYSIMDILPIPFPISWFLFTTCIQWRSTTFHDTWISRRSLLHMCIIPHSDGWIYFIYQAVHQDSITIMQHLHARTAQLGIGRQVELPWQQNVSHVRLTWLQTVRGQQTLLIAVRGRHQVGRGGSIWLSIGRQVELLRQQNVIHVGRTWLQTQRGQQTLRIVVRWPWAWGFSLHVVFFTVGYWSTGGAPPQTECNPCEANMTTHSEGATNSLDCGKSVQRGWGDVLYLGHRVELPHQVNVTHVRRTWLHTLRGRWVLVIRSSPTNRM